ncbi:MAG TPA: plastocyanin/azurin family copper-binding protein, partial [Anseongella sp.]|nr:plastocyanin/azurin family copper-binding protein [Anseongella sp.]
NRKNGYAVYVKEGRLHFQLNRNGRRKILSTAGELPAEFGLRAQLRKDGNMTLALDGKEGVQANAGGLFESRPEGNLTAGYDREEDGHAGDYDEDFEFEGSIENGRIVFLLAEAGDATAAEADQVIQLGAVVNEMKYDKELLQLKAGSTVKIVFTNSDHMLHNLLILRPGSMEKVGAAADQLAQDPQGASRDYIPEMPEVLFATPLVDPGSSYELVFRVPERPGEYPFVCTFPGHWRIMNGIIRVE